MVMPQVNSVCPPAGSGSVGPDQSDPWGTFYYIQNNQHADLSTILCGSSQLLLNYVRKALFLESSVLFTLARFSLRSDVTEAWEEQGQHRVVTPARLVTPTSTHTRPAHKCVFPGNTWCPRVHSPLTDG
jgi:hypothetical protein